MTPRIFFLIACLSISICSLSQSTRKKISDFEIVIDTMASRAPGRWIPMGIEVIKKNGTKTSTRGFLKGSYAWKNFSVEVTGGKFQNGYILVSDNPEDFPDEKIAIQAYPIENPELKKNYTFRIDYSGKFSANYSGYHGSDGLDGKSGCSSTCRGENGENGEHGDSGSDGFDLEVLVKYSKEDEIEYLHLLIHNVETGAKTPYKINARKGVLKISSNGGNGGDGGDGGKGGDGIHKGRGGNGGYGGNGGNGGNGGTIKVFATPEAAPFLSVIAIENFGGTSGKGGRKGYRGEAGCNFPVEKHDSFLGQLLADKGNGTGGMKGRDGYAGAAGPKPEIVIIDYSYEW